MPTRWTKMVRLPGAWKPLKSIHRVINRSCSQLNMWIYWPQIESTWLPALMQISNLDFLSLVMTVCCWHNLSFKRQVVFSWRDLAVSVSQGKNHLPKFGFCYVYRLKFKNFSIADIEMAELELVEEGGGLASKGKSRSSMRKDGDACDSFVG